MQSIILNFERELNFTATGETRKGKLLISRLEYLEAGDAWACYWSLDFVKPELSSVYGRDPLDSLTAALWLASELVRDSGIPDLQIWWRKPGDNGGLQESYADDEVRTGKAPQKRNQGPQRIRPS